MKVAIIGATRGVGRQLVEQTLAQGHRVWALVRDPGRMDLHHPHLHLIPGDVLDPAAVGGLVAGAECVVMSLGKTADNPVDVCSRGTRNVVEAMKEAGRRRLIVVTSMGVGDSRDQVSLGFRLVMMTALKAVMADKEAQERIVRESGLDWTLVRPGGLLDTPATGQYVHGLDKKITAGRISRADVAAFILQTLETGAYVGQAVSVT